MAEHHSDHHRSLSSPVPAHAPAAPGSPAAKKPLAPPPPPPPPPHGAKPSASSSPSPSPASASPAPTSPTASALVSSAAFSASLADEKTRRVEFDQLRTSLKQALTKRDTAATRDALSKIIALKLTDPTVVEATTQAQTFLDGERKSELTTLQFYLKQGFDMKSKDALKLSLGKVDALIKTSGSADFKPDFTELIEKCRKMVTAMDKEQADTYKFYLKQGLQMKNRDILKETMDKAQAAGVLNSIDKDVVSGAQELLKALDAQHLIKFFLQSATKQKDIEGLDTALGKAKALNMGLDIKEVKEATDLLNHLKSKQKKANAKTAPFSFFSSKPKEGDKKTTPLFGGKLAEAVKKSDREIPKICYKCIEFLEAKGLLEAGLFRVPGNNDNINALERQFSEDIDVKLDDVHDTAGVLKLYLRKLPDPLIPYDQYAAFIKAGQQFNQKDPKRWQKLKELCVAIPPENLALLKYLCTFLSKVASHQDVNKMNTDNIAIVFAPNLLRPAVETAQSMMQEMPVSISVISTFIDHFNDIFPASAPTPAVVAPGATPH